MNKEQGTRNKEQGTERDNNITYFILKPNKNTIYLV